MQKNIFGLFKKNKEAPKLISGENEKTATLKAVVGATLTPKEEKALIEIIRKADFCGLKITKSDAIRGALLIVAEKENGKIARHLIKHGLAKPQVKKRPRKAA